MMNLGHPTKRDVDSQSKGGKARAEKLTAEERSEIARKAAEARWLAESEKVKQFGAMAPATSVALNRRYARHIAAAGEFAVMSKLASRGYNVSKPGIDRGEDLWVLEEATGELSRLQIKTRNRDLRYNPKTIDAVRFAFEANKRDISECDTGRFWIFVMHLTFDVAHSGRDPWSCIVLSQEELLEYLNQGKIASSFTDPNTKQSKWKIRFLLFGDGRVTTQKRDDTKKRFDLGRHLENWDPWWPDLTHYNG